jgi:hypothetical protein
MGTNKVSSPARSANGRAKKSTAGRKVGHVLLLPNTSTEIIELAIGDIFPSPENSTVYHPLSMENPDDAALVKSVRIHGILDPIIITLENYILSGHRRHWAARAAGLKVVPCRRIGMLRDDPRFLPLLAECNKQRNKSFDEILHETVLAANPEEAHRALLEYRQRVAQVSADTIEIVGTIRRNPISSAKAPMLDAIDAIIEEMKSFWPITDRQIHYGLLNAPPLIHASKPNSLYRNNLESYKALCELITRARLGGLIPYQAIHDPTRPVTLFDVHAGVGPFLEREIERFLKGYWRNLQASQPCHIEILAEKLTVQSILHTVAAEYRIPMTIGRGYSSIPPRYEMAQRFRQSGKDRLVLLVVGDQDPEGEDIGHSFARSMRDDFGVLGIDPIKVALTSQQVADLNLPPMMIAKKKSSRRKTFTDKHGEHVYELEAVPPATLQHFLREVIDSVLDVDAFNEELDAEKQDAAQLAERRKSVHKALVRMERRRP